MDKHIIERLKEAIQYGGPTLPCGHFEILTDALDEIERLRDALERRESASSAKAFICPRCGRESGEHKPMPYQAAGWRTAICPTDPDFNDWTHDRRENAKLLGPDGRRLPSPQEEKP